MPVSSLWGILRVFINKHERHSKKDALSRESGLRAQLTRASSRGPLCSPFVLRLPLQLNYPSGSTFSKVGQLSWNRIPKKNVQLPKKKVKYAGVVDIKCEIRQFHAVVGQ